MKKTISSLKMKKWDLLILLLICMLQLCLSLFWTGQKKYLAPDELFSYVSANNPDYIGNVPKNTWLDEAWYQDYVSADQEHRFDYAIPYHNQDQDVHPPLFYLFLHTASSMLPGEFSYFTGTAFNILFFMICTVILYFLGREVFSSRGCGLLAAFLFAISYAGMNTVVFIRMYMLMTMFVLLHALVYMKYLEQEKIPLRGYLFLGLTLIAGVLTQYYFVIIAFFFALWYGVRFIRQQDWKKVIPFVSVFAISALISILLYPTMLDHIFGTSRGVEARENLSSLGGYFQKIKTMWELLDSQLFTGFGIALLAVLLIMGMLCKKKKSDVERRQITKTGMLLFACIGYFLIVTKIAPYQIDRYLMPVYPLIYLLAIGWIFTFFKQWMPAKAAVGLCILGFGGLSFVHMVHSSIPYTYVKDTIVSERLELAEEYQEYFALYFGKEEDMYDYYDALQVLKIYKGFYNVGDLSDLGNISEEMSCLREEEGVLLYISHDMEEVEMSEMLEQLVAESDLSQKEFLQTDEAWDVYLLKP